MKKIKKEFLKLSKSNFVTNSFKMSLGVVLSQLLNLLYVIAFSRIFFQEAYAIQANFLSVLNILFLLCSLGLVSALAIPKEIDRIDLILKSILFFAFFISMAIGIVFFISEVFFNYDLTYAIFKLNLSFFYILLPLATFSRLVMLIYETRLSLLGKFSQLSIIKVLTAVVYGAVTYVFYVITKDNVISLVIGNIFSYAIIAVIMFLMYRINFFKLKKIELGYIFKRYKDFLYFSLPNLLMNAISFSLPSILLLQFYGDEIAGDYAMGLKVVSIPVSFIVASLKSVYLKKISDIYRENKSHFYEFIKKVLLYSHFGSFFLFAVIFILAPYLTKYVLGEGWENSFIYIRLLCIWQFLLIGNSPLSIVFQIIEKQKVDFYREILLLVFRVFSVVGCFYMGFSGIVAVTAFVLVGFVFNIIMSIMILYYSKKEVYENNVYR